MTDRNELIRDLGQIPHDEDGPAFSAPWEAATFALAVRLSQEGHFTWGEWAETLTQEIAEAQRQGDPDLGNTYYRHWASALERLCAEKNLVGRPEMDQREEEWRRAYLNTPHGKPIELAAAFEVGSERASPSRRAKVGPDTLAPSVGRPPRRPHDPGTRTSSPSG